MTPSSNENIIAIASDHAGLEAKHEVRILLEERSLQVKDLGTEDGESVDYPDYAHALCRDIESGNTNRGVLVCGSGIGMSIAANRHPGIRAALCTSAEVARLSREHNDSNVLCLSGRLTGPEDRADIVRAWLETPFEGGRHAGRIAKLDSGGSTPVSSPGLSSPGLSSPGLSSPGAQAYAENVVVFDHPLIQHKLTVLRDRECQTKVFRETVEELSSLMAYELTRDIPVNDKTVMTPMDLEAMGKTVGSDRLAVIPILRAGLGMLGGILSVIPMAAVGIVGLYRDHESLEPVEYYVKLPNNLEQRVCIVVDPMLATGGSAAAAIDFLKKRGARNIKFNCLLAAPEGIERLSKAHPDVAIYCAGVDEKLNEIGYILPGLGDAGDRLFGTK